MKNISIRTIPVKRYLRIILTTFVGNAYSIVDDFTPVQTIYTICDGIRDAENMST